MVRVVSKLLWKIFQLFIIAGHVVESQCSYNFWYLTQILFNRSMDFQCGVGRVKQMNFLLSGLMKFVYPWNWCSSFRDQHSCIGPHKTEAFAKFINKNGLQLRINFWLYWLNVLLVSFDSVIRFVRLNNQQESKS